MSDRLHVELTRGVIVVRYDGRPDDAAFQAYLDSYTEFLKRGVSYATVYTTGPDARMPTSGQVRMQVRWMKEYRDLSSALSKGLAFHLPSPLMRGVLRGVLSIQPLGAKHIVVETEAEAMRWAQARLREG